MSISGTGTQADPYIVDSWADFVTAVGESGVYVEVDTSNVNTWDFAKIVDSGLSSALSWNAANVNGNGLTIKGLYASGSFSYMITLSGGATNKYIRNINFLDFSKPSSVTSVFYGKKIYFGNCQFSGIVDGGSFLSRVATNPQGGYVFSTAVNDGVAKGCSFALQFNGTATFGSSEYCDIYHGNMNFVKASESTSVWKVALYETKITGEFPFASITNSGGGQNVIDADISSIGTWTNNSGVTLVNTDKLAEGLTVPTGFTGVTSAQMLDVDALAAVGFTAFPETEPEENTETTEGGE